jgi:ElaB/YqjD/DUF883 family membrane-anchored ribosome-binding protein
MGYVNMDALVKKHPLYGELEKLDADMQALQLKSLDANMPRASGADLAREEKNLQKELNDATNRAKKALKDKQEEYAKREQAAIAAALGAAAGSAGPSGASIAGRFRCLPASDGRAKPRGPRGPAALAPGTSCANLPDEG